MRSLSTLRRNDRGEAMVGYALIVVLITVGAIMAVRAVGAATSDSFETIAAAIPSGALATTLPELTPEEKWEKAQANHTAAAEEAKSKQAADIAEANAMRDAQIDANKALPKPERQAANQEAKATRNAAVDAAKAEYKASVAAANAAKNAAKTEYQASKKK